MVVLLKYQAYGIGPKLSDRVGNLLLAPLQRDESSLSGRILLHTIAIFLYFKHFFGFLYLTFLCAPMTLEKPLSHEVACLVA